MSEYAEIFKALSEETRLTILSMLLNHGELCVCDVEAVLQISQSKASRHLRYLKNAGLVDDRREGVWVYYKIAEKSDSEASVVLKSNRKIFHSLLDESIESRLEEWLAAKATRGNICEAESKK